MDHPASPLRPVRSPRLRRLRRAVLARRRPLAAVAAGAAVALTLQATAAPATPTALVLTAAHDLPGGTVIRAHDLARTPLPPGSVPAGSARSAADLLGRTTAAPLRAGEPITDVRLVGRSLLEGYPGTVAAPVRIADAGAVGLLRVGDRVDVLAADPQGAGAAEVVAERVPVVALPRALRDDGLATGGLVVFALTPDSARAVAGAGVSHYLSVVLTH